jgi:hypothetical protein
MGRNGNDESPVRLNGIANASVCPRVARFSMEDQPKFCGVSGWIDKISRTWARGPANTLALARLLHEARRNMKHGQWSDLWRSPRLPFSKRKAEMLVSIGQVLGGLNAKNSAHLPTAWNTLYHIAQLGQELAMRLIGEGRIHPRMALREARKLAEQYGPKTVRNTRAPSTLRRRLNRFSDFMLTRSAGWTTDDREFVRAELQRLLKNLIKQTLYQ